MKYIHSNFTDLRATGEEHERGESLLAVHVISYRFVGTSHEKRSVIKMGDHERSDS